MNLLLISWWKVGIGTKMALTSNQSKTEINSVVVVLVLWQMPISIPRRSVCVPVVNWYRHMKMVIT